MNDSVQDSGTGQAMEPAGSKRWYVRRGPQVALAGTLAAGLAVAGIGIGAAANAEVDPEQAVAEAGANLKELPTSVTISGIDGKPGELTLTRTEQGTQISVESPQRGGTFDVALVGERLYLRVAADQLDGVRSSPIAGLTAGFPAVTALLNGQWVSIDASEGSESLAALRSLNTKQAGDPAALKAAADELRASLDAIRSDVREPLRDALADNSGVAVAQGSAEGPAGSDHYQVTIDRQAVAGELEPMLRQAMDDAVAAVDTFVAEVGSDLPNGGDGWTAKRAELLAAFDTALADGPAKGSGSVDVWIADGEFTQISFDQATVTFDPDPALVTPDDAVSMDQDLVKLVPLLQGFGLPAFAGR